MEDKQTKITGDKEKKVVFIPLEETRLQFGDIVRKDKDGKIVITRYKN
jgi:hypothetical protein